MAVPLTRDNKQVVVIAPHTEGFRTYITSRGDDLNPTPPASGIAAGNQMVLTFDQNDTAGTTKSVDIRFREPVEIHDGEVCWAPVSQWSYQDEFSVGLNIPANTVSSTPGAGNCNLYPIGGGLNAIIPAVGGDYTIDLDDASPVERGVGDSLSLWSVDYATGVISAGGKAPAWALFDFALNPSYLARISCIDPSGAFNFDAYKVEYFHPNWILKFSATKNVQATAACQIGGWLFAFRKNLT